MKKKVVISSILLVLIVIFLHYPHLSARKNPYSGILPPSRLNRATDVNVELMKPEEAEPPDTFPDLLLAINIPARKVTLYDKGEEVLRHDVAVGQPIYKTPEGEQKVGLIIWNPWWIPPDSPWAKGESKAPPGPNNPLGPVKLMMRQGIRLHGTNKASSVGRFASHGCLRMRNDEVANLAWYIQKRINNSDDSLFKKYKRNRRRSFYTKLDIPLKVEIVYEPVEIRNNMVYIYTDTYRWSGDVKSAVVDALIKNGIDLKMIDAGKISQLQFPKKRYDVIEVELCELLTRRLRMSDQCYVSRE